MGKVTLVVLNAGEASRLRPLTSGTSKAMIRLNGKPVIDHIVESVGVDNIETLVLVQGRLDDAQSYVERRGYPFLRTYVRQDEPLGPMHAVKCAAPYTHGPVVVWFGDTLVFGELPLGETFFATHDVPDQSEWLVWDGHEFRDRPREGVPSGRAFVGVFGAESADLLHRAKNAVADDDFPRFMRVLRALGRGREVRDVEWYDIGVPARYYATCAALLNRRTRAFNSFHYESELGVLTKIAEGAEARMTLEAEALWYESLTRRQSLVTPRFVGWNPGHYNELQLGYEPGILLSDLALYHDLPASFWDYALCRVVSLARNVLHSGRSTTSNFNAGFAKYSQEMWVEGVASRLARTDVPLRDQAFLLDSAANVARRSHPVGTMHGDMHLSNILYEPTTGKLTLIDPRGRYGSYVGPAGGDMYDFCKLGYDCYHGFSAIVAGVSNNPVLATALDGALEREGIDRETVRDGAAVLMAAGIPLHYDNVRRQAAFKERVTIHVRGRLDAEAA